MIDNHDGTFSREYTTYNHRFVFVDDELPILKRFAKEYEVDVECTVNIIIRSGIGDLRAYYHDIDQAKT